MRIWSSWVLLLWSWDSSSRHVALHSGLSTWKHSGFQKFNTTGLYDTLVDVMKLEGPRRVRHSGCLQMWAVQLRPMRRGTRNIRVTTRGRTRKKALAQLLAEISEAKKEACHLKIASADGFSMPTALLCKNVNHPQMMAWSSSVKRTQRLCLSPS